MIKQAHASGIDLVPVILCGGSGTRLWPLSRELYPKPFIKMPNGHTLFIDTILRAKSFSPQRRPIIICNEEHRFFVLDSLEEAGVDAMIILEPAGRNTAPAAALAAQAVLELEDAPMLIMPSDHSFGDNSNFINAVTTSLPFARDGSIITFGINPSKPETGYGYIQQGQLLGNGCYRAERFVEKPDEATAAAMLETGGFFWNSGIFLLKASVYLQELAEQTPDIYQACLQAWQGKNMDGRFIRPDREKFLSSPDNSIDYAIMEHTRAAAVTPCDVQWSDLGSWDAIYQAASSDGNGNVLRGDVIAEDSDNCYLHSGGRLVAAIGLRDMIVVDSGDSVLVMPRQRKEDVKKIVARLKKDQREQYRLHPVVHRPWGTYEKLASGDRFQVKRIIVRPGASLSLQLHHHRSEHWIVVRGTAEVTVGYASSVYIPLGTRHKLHNPGIIPLELIEVQSGSYLGEDDIVRMEDSYGRS